MFHIGRFMMTTMQSISRHFAQCPHFNRICRSGGAVSSIDTSYSVKSTPAPKASDGHMLEGLYPCLSV